MGHPDVDRLLREERFDELARLGALPAARLRKHKTLRGLLVARLRIALTPARGAVAGAVTIRHARPNDRAAVERLAAMDERRTPSGPLLLAEVEEQILAALPLDGTAAISHPLHSTAGLIDLLELRSRQLERQAA